MTKLWLKDGLHMVDESVAYEVLRLQGVVTDLEQEIESLEGDPEQELWRLQERKATIAEVRRRAKDRRDETQLYDIHGEQIFSLEDLNNILDEMEAEG